MILLMAQITLLISEVTIILELISKQPWPKKEARGMKYIS